MQARRHLLKAIEIHTRVIGASLSVVHTPLQPQHAAAVGMPAVPLRSEAMPSLPY